MNVHASPIIEPSHFPLLKLWSSFTCESIQQQPRYKKLSHLQLGVVV